MVRWGLVYRSGRLSRLDDADREILRGIGLRAICDLRTTSEREEEPSDLMSSAINYIAADYEFSHGHLALISSRLRTTEDSRRLMIANYRQLPEEQAQSFQNMFRALLRDDLPIIINCTAGKDRTGVASAILLSVLGVVRETVIDDYVLTNEAIPIWSPPPPHLEPLYIAHRDYLLAMFEAIDARWGNIVQYAEQALQLDEAAVGRLKARLLS